MQTNLFDSHYKYAIFPTLGDLKAIVDGDLSTIKLLMDIMSSTMAFVSIRYIFVGECLVWIGLDWECFLVGLFNCKVCFQAIICVRDRKAFSHLFAIMSKY
jgi:hypothetical protein